MFRSIAESNSCTLVIGNKEHGQQTSCKRIRPHNKKCEDRYNNVCGDIHSRGIATIALGMSQS